MADIEDGHSQLVPYSGGQSASSPDILLTRPAVGAHAEVASLSGQRAARHTGFNRRLGDFLARQADAKYETRRKVALLHRDLCEDGRREDDRMLHGANGLDGFRKMLYARYGTLPCAWRVGLDRDGNGKISFGELRQCCHALGFTGNLKKLWQDMDTSGDGFISLQELDPEAHKGINAFRDFLEERFGSTIVAWEEGFSLNGARSVSAAAFVERCAAMQFPGDAAKLFKWLRTDMARQELTLQDLDPAAAAALVRGDPCAQSIAAGQLRRVFTSPAPLAPLSPLAASRMVSAEASSTAGSISPQGSLSSNTPQARSQSVTARGFMHSKQRPPMLSQLNSPTGTSETSLLSPLPRADHAAPTRNSSWTRDVSIAQIAELKAQKGWHYERDMSIKTLDDLKSLLVSRFGSILSGWQLALDPLAKGKLSFMEFSERLRHVGYLGDLRALWVDLGAKKAGVLRLSDLDPQAEALLSEFREKLGNQHGNMLKAWTSAFDPQGRGVVGQDRFVTQCNDAGFTGDAAKLFHMLQDKGDGGSSGQKYLSLREFDLRAHRAYGRDDQEMVTEAEARMPPLESTFDDRQDQNFAARWKKVQTNLLIAAHKKLKSEQLQQDAGCSNLNTLRAVLVRKYGSCATAWRVALDPLRQGQLSSEEFVKAVRQRVGYQGSLKDLWDEIDKSSPNFVTLNDLDASAAELLWLFRELLLSKYGNLISGWNQGLDPRNSGRLEEEEFCKRCEALAFGGDAHQLFVCLRSGPHKRFVTLSDIDLEAAHAGYRGDHEAMTMHGHGAGPKTSPKHWAGRASVIGLGTGAQEQSASDSEAGNPARCTRLSEWSRELGRRQRAGVGEREREEMEKTLGVKSLEDFRKALASRFRSTVAAWRCVIDPECSNHITFSQFCLALDHLGGYTGKVKQLWRELDVENQGYFSFKDFDAKADAALTEFRTALLAKFSSLRSVWSKCLAVDQVEMLDEKSFIERCAEHLDGAWTDRNLKRAFRYLLPEPLRGRHHIIEADLQALLLNVPPHQQQQLWLGTVASLQASEKDSLVKAGSPRSLRPAPEPNFNLPAFEREGFNKLLRTNFGSVYAGWAKHLDVAETGRVPKGEFAQRAKAIGVGGNVNSLYHSIDKNGKGYITLHDLDAEIAEAIDCFFQLAASKFTSLEECWATFDPGAKRYVVEKEFEKGCAQLGYPHDAIKLFHFFRPEKSRSCLFLEDLGPAGVLEVRKIRSQHTKDRRNRSPRSKGTSPGGARRGNLAGQPDFDEVEDPGYDPTQTPLS